MSLDRLLEAMHNQGFAPADGLRGLPPEAYHSDELHRLEIERIFMREWLCVGRLDQVPSPGDYRCLDLADEPLVYHLLPAGTAVLRHVTDYVN